MDKGDILQYRIFNTYDNINGINECNNERIYGIYNIIFFNLFLSKQEEIIWLSNQKLKQ